MAKNSPTARPANEPDLEAKFAEFPAVAERGGQAYVWWWRALNDPALSSLGGGVRSLNMGTAVALSDTTLVLAQPTLNEHRDIPRDAIFKLHYPAAGAVPEDVIAEQTEPGEMP